MLLQPPSSTRTDTPFPYTTLFRVILKIVADPKALDADEAEARSLSRLGLVYERMDAAACAALEPSLEPLVPNLAGGIFFPHDESGDACKFSQELAAACRQLGVSFRFGTSVIRILASHQRVAGVETDRGRFEADHYVLATGCASTALARAIGIDLPIYPVRSEEHMSELQSLMRISYAVFCLKKK